jgi:hypothetical protein
MSQYISKVTRNSKLKLRQYTVPTLASEHGIIVNSPALGWRTRVSAKVFGRQRRAPSIDIASVRGVCNAETRCNSDNLFLTVLITDIIISTFHTADILGEFHKFTYANSTVIIALQVSSD